MTLVCWSCRQTDTVVLSLLMETYFGVPLSLTVKCGAKSSTKVWLGLLILSACLSMSATRNTCNPTSSILAKHYHSNSCQIINNHKRKQQDGDPPCIRKVKRKLVPYSIMSIEHGADPSFLAVSPQATLVINPVVGCRYFPPGAQLLSQPKRSHPCPVPNYTALT